MTEKNTKKQNKKNKSKVSTDDNNVKNDINVKEMPDWSCDDYSEECVNECTDKCKLNEQGHENDEIVSDGKETTNQCNNHKEDCDKSCDIDEKCAQGDCQDKHECKKNKEEEIVPDKKTEVKEEELVKEEEKVVDEQHVDKVGDNHKEEKNKLRFFKHRRR
jgi:hypothetical protein